MNNRVLVIQTAFLGDAILTLPLIQEIKRKFGNSKIDVVCTPATKEIFLLSPYVESVIVLDKKNKHKSLISTIKFALRLRNQKYEYLFSPHRSFRSSIIALFSGANHKTGFDNATLSFVYSHKIKYEKKLHEVARNLSLLKDPELLRNWKILPECNLPEKNILENLPLNSTDNLIAVAPGSVWETKKYPKEYFIQLVSKLASEKYTILLIGGKEDENLCAEIKNSADKTNNIINLAGKLKISESISVLKKCRLLICNDSAPTHMGMCANIPVLTIYCSTVPDFGFYPYNSKSSFVSYDKLECKPCGIHGHQKCPVNTFDCGFKLTPETVYNEVKMLLEKN